VQIVYAVTKEVSMTFQLQGQKFPIGLVQFPDELEMLRIGQSCRSLGSGTTVRIHAGLPKYFTYSYTDIVFSIVHIKNNALSVLRALFQLK